jgi:hypothetical protein
MKTYLFFLIPAFLYISCNEEKKEDKTIPEENKSQKTDGKTESEEIICKSLPENHFAGPFLTNETNRDFKAVLELSVNENNVFSGNLKVNDSLIDFEFNPSKLIAKIPALTSSNPYHQKVAIWLFEKEWQNDSILISDKTWIKFINSPLSDIWFAEVFESNPVKKRKASFSIIVPDKIYFELFNKFYPGFDKNLINYRTQTPEPEKINYNQLRKMGKFYEGFAGETGSLKPSDNDTEKKTFLRRLNSIKTYRDYFENDFNVSATDLNGFDSTEKEAQSVKDFYNVKSFIYKTTYSLNTVSKDSLLEIQFDFKDKNNTPTQRLVIGGIPFSSMMKLNLNDYAKAPLIPVGFSVDPEMPDQFCLISNMSGYWSDTGLGRNISGVKIYWDKLNKSKLHIWLIGSDGITPLMHYISILDKLFVK